MKKTFELKTWLSENRTSVLVKYDELQKEQNFSGISLKDFMVKILNLMTINNVKSEKRAFSMLSTIIEVVYTANVKIEVVRDRDTETANKYKGTAYMALV
jgi:hypothetical protein